MNLDALLAAISPDGGPNSPAPPPELSAPPAAAATVPPPDAGPQLPVGPQLPPGGAPSGGSGIAEHLQEMLPMLIAGLMSGAALKNPGPYGRGEDVAGLAQGLLHGYHTSKQGQLAAAKDALAAREQVVKERQLTLQEDRQQQDALDRAAGRTQKTTELAQHRSELSTSFLLNAVKGAEQFKDDPAAWASYTKMMDNIGAKTFGLEPGTLTSQLQFPDASRGKKAVKDAKARVDDLTKLYGPEKMFAPEVLDATTTFDGKSVKVRDLMALAEMTITKPGDAKAQPAGQEVTALSPKEETAFQNWVKSNGITDADNPDAHYDYRGFWKDTDGAPHKQGDHFPDTFKQHGHPTFSVESKYSKGATDGGRWQGDTFTPPASAAPASDLVTPTPKDEPLDRQVLRSYAKKVGKAVPDLTPADIKAAREEAGMGADPAMRDLTRQIAQARLDDLKNKNAGVSEIKPGTPEYRMAENIAFGKTTLSQAKGLYSGREAKGKETLRAVLDKAEQINPDFNAALFEQGYKFASNPKTQMAMVAVNRVEPNIDKLMDLTDKWDRTKYPTVNAFLKSVKFQWGDRVISDISQLQTIVGDELGPALGVGTATDLKTKLGLEMAGGTKGPEAMRSGLMLVKDALNNQKRALLGQMGQYGKTEIDKMNATGGQPQPVPSHAPAVNPFRKP